MQSERTYFSEPWALTTGPRGAPLLFVLDKNPACGKNIRFESILRRRCSAFNCVPSPLRLRPVGEPREAHVPAQGCQAQADPRLPRPHADPGGPPYAEPSPCQGPQAPCRLTARRARRAVRRSLAKGAHLRAGADIRRIIRKGRRVEAGPYVVHGLPAATPAGSRLAVVVPGRVGTAVVRNRIKRTFREAFRLGRAEWRRDWDLVVYVRSLPGPITMQRAAEALEQAVTTFEPTSSSNG